MNPTDDVRSILAEAETKAEAAIRAARRQLLHLALRGGTVTADSYTAGIDVPDGVSARALGSAAPALARLGLIENVGYEKSKRPERRGTTNTVWRLKPGAEADAHRWLINHPPLRPPREPAGSQLNLPGL